MDLSKRKKAIRERINDDHLCKALTTLINVSDPAEKEKESKIKEQAKEEKQKNESKKLTPTMIEDLEALMVVRSILTNVAKHPNEDKYKSIKLTNPKLIRTLINERAHLCLVSAGFVINPKEGVLVLPNRINIKGFTALLISLKQELDKICELSRAEPPQPRSIYETLKYPEINDKYAKGCELHRGSYAIFVTEAKESYEVEMKNKRTPFLTHLYARLLQGRGIIAMSETCSAKLGSKDHGGIAEMNQGNFCLCQRMIASFIGHDEFCSCRRVKTCPYFHITSNFDTYENVIPKPRELEFQPLLTKDDTFDMMKYINSIL